MGRLAHLDAVTFDANGTLARLIDPVPKLEQALRQHGIDRPRAEVARAFEAEGRYYKPRSLLGHDDLSLATLHRRCTGVFLDELEADLDPATFATAYVGALVFEILPGVTEALGKLRKRGLELAVVSNWDLTLPDRLDQLGVTESLRTIVSSAEAGIAKPDPAIFEVALSRLGVNPGRALHIGDAAADEAGAGAAGMHFAWAPVPTALENWL
jgi:putative hydrolase of the HAD superfamily